jgi:hypothetical protein
MGERLSFDTPDELKAAAEARMISPVIGTLLEVGPYVRPQPFMYATSFMFIEPHLPYLEQVHKMHREKEQELGFAIPAVFLHAVADEAMPLLLDKSVDTVYAGDVIEHMSKEAGRRFIFQAKRVARRQVILFTPLDFMPQVYTPGFIDAHGQEDSHWQEHRSGWTPDDFGPEWDILTCERYHTSNYGRPEAVHEGHGAFFAIYTAPEGDSGVRAMPIGRLEA